MLTLAAEGQEATPDKLDKCSPEDLKKWHIAKGEVIVGPGTDIKYQAKKKPNDPTVMPDGQPQTTPVWCDRHDGFIFVNMMKGFRKEKNMRLNPKVPLLAYDPNNPLHIRVGG